jgi:hypothetical protein
MDTRYQPIDYDVYRRRAHDLRRDEIDRVLRALGSALSTGVARLVGIRGTRARRADPPIRRVGVCLR